MRQILRLTGSIEDGEEESGNGAFIGTFKLTDPNYFYEGVETFRLPLGCSAKLWGYTLSGKEFTANMLVSHDGVVWEEVSAWVLKDERGILARSYKGRPEVFLESRTGTEMFKVEWSSVAEDPAGRIVLLVEISDEI